MTTFRIIHYERRRIAGRWPAAAFSLVEVLTALAITSALSIMLLQALAALRNIDSQQANARRVAETRLVFERLISEIEQLFNASATFEHQSLTGTPQLNNGFRHDKLEMIGHGATQRSAPQKLTFFLTPVGRGGLSNLVIRNSLLGVDPDVPDTTVLERIQELRIDYLDVNGWHDRWDGAATRDSPMAVRIAVTFAAGITAGTKNESDDAAVAHTLIGYAVPLIGTR